MHRELKVLLAVACVTAVVWVGWGVFGGVAVLSIYAVSFFARSALVLSRHQTGSRPLEPPGLVAVTAPMSPVVAEFFCQELESRGIAATYFGRSAASGGLPGGRFSIALGRVSVAVHEEAAERAVEVVNQLRRELEQKTTSGSTDDQTSPAAAVAPAAGDSELQRAALAAFGVDTPRFRWGGLRRRR